MELKKYLKKKIQYGVLPFRTTADGRTEVFLITSRERQRWIIPKGWPMKGRTPPWAAAREAYEEGGLVGEVGSEPLGSYEYTKRLKGGRTTVCEVVIYPLEVREQHDEWPEKGQRQVRWFAGPDAVKTIDDKALADLVEAFVQADRAAPELARHGRVRISRDDRRYLLVNVHRLAARALRRFVERWSPARRLFRGPGLTTHKIGPT